MIKKNGTKSLLIIFSIGAVICAYFWTFLRYPDLDVKAMMSGFVADDSLKLGFDHFFEVTSQTPLWKKIMYTSLEWTYTNRQGMTFGIVFSTIIVTIIQLLEFKPGKSKFLNTLAGVMIGSPAGVCVNCSTPIMQGLVGSKLPIQVGMAALFSSPTLNWIVLTMTFSLFPLYMGFLKVSFTLFFIFFIVPFLPYKVGSIEEPHPSFIKSFLPKFSTPEGNSWWSAIKWTVKSLLSSFKSIIILTLPLMILSGFLGAVVINILPLNNMIFDNFSYLHLIIISAAALFLPCPMTFDVVLVQSLLMMGAPSVYLTPLLFSLGIFSVFPFLVIWKQVSKKVSVIILAILFIMTLLLSFLDSWYTGYNEKKNNDLTQTHQLQIKSAKYYNLSLPTPIKNESSKLIYQKDNITIETSAHSLRVGGELPFDDRSSEILKFSSTGFYNYLFLDFGPSVSAGDFNRDGYEDFMVSGQNRLELYINENGKFGKNILLELDPQELISLSALVDLNNDKWLDVFYSVRGRGTGVIYSQKGRLNTNETKWLNKSTTTLLQSAGFADVDKNGLLDIFMGNATATVLTPWGTQSSKNFWMMQNNTGLFVPVELPGELLGETYANLVSDLDLDGYLDTFVGNDYGVPDFLYRGLPKAKWEKLSPEKKMFPHFPEYSMSLDSADIDNDLDLDVYSVQISGIFSRSKTKAMLSADVAKYCYQIDDPKEKNNCVAFMKIVGGARSDACQKYDNVDQQTSCLFQNMLSIAIYKKDKSICQKINTSDNFLKNYCLKIIEEFAERSSQAYYDFKKQFKAENDFRVNEENLNKFFVNEHKQIRTSNSLFVNDKNKFTDEAKSYGVAYAGWGWNAVFADLDNDGWQDLYVANGVLPSWAHIQIKIISNIFYKNEKGKKFTALTNEFGLSDYKIVFSYIYSDIDNDGDLDLIEAPFSSPLRVFRNTDVKNSAVTFELKDSLLNSHSIGARLYIYYGSDHQMREVKLSGGFHSFSSTRLHFGTGQNKKIDRIKIIWSDGKEITIDGPLNTNQHYSISRTK